MIGVMEVTELKTYWDVEHCDKDGRLISRQKVIEMPSLPTEPSRPNMTNINCLICLKQYIRDFNSWSRACKNLMNDYYAVREYQKVRVDFAEKYRHSEIPEKYRTGEPSPSNKGEARAEIATIKKLIREMK